MGDQSVLLLAVFAFLALQNMLGYFFQIRQYQKMIRKWLGRGILGVGQRRGLFMPGELCIVVYNPVEDRVLSVQSMRGYSIFVRFKEKGEYAGFGLAGLRAAALEADSRDLGLWRILFRYRAHKVTKRKGAFIQAVEGVEKRVEERAEKKRPDMLPASYIGAAYGDPVVETPASRSSAAEPGMVKSAVEKPAAELAQRSWADLSPHNNTAKDVPVYDAAAKDAEEKAAEAKPAGEKKHE